MDAVTWSALPAVGAPVALPSVAANMRAEPVEVGEMGTDRAGPLRSPLVMAPMGAVALAPVKTWTATAIESMYWPSPTPTVALTVMGPGALGAEAHHTPTAPMEEVSPWKSACAQSKWAFRLSVTDALVHGAGA
jgi:hypothetical protein